MVPVGADGDLLWKKFYRFGLQLFQVLPCIPVSISIQVVDEFYLVILGGQVTEGKEAILLHSLLTYYIFLTDQLYETSSVSWARS